MGLKIDQYLFILVYPYRTVNFLIIDLLTVQYVIGPGVYLWLVQGLLSEDFSDIVGGGVDLVLDVNPVPGE